MKKDGFAFFHFIFISNVCLDFFSIVGNKERRTYALDRKSEKNHE